MGTIAEKGAYTIETKSLLKDKINNLGGSIDNNTTFRNYANQLQTIYDNLPKTSYQEGTEVNLGVTTKGKLDYDNGVVGIGQSSQDGTPTPSTPIAINSVTGNQDVIVKSGNLANPQLERGSIDATTGEEIVNDNYCRMVNYIYFGSASKLYFKRSDGTVNLKARWYNKNLGYVGSSPSINNKTTVELTPPNNAEYLRIAIDDSNLNYFTDNSVIISVLDTPYEPYITPTSYQLSLGDIELNAIGNYKDELIYDVDEDRVYKKANIKSAILSSTNQTWETQGTNVTTKKRYSTNAFASEIVAPSISSNLGILMCNYYGNQVAGTSGSYGGNQGVSISSNGSIYVNDSRYDNDIDGWKTWLNSVICKVYYALQTPVETEITDTTLINQVKSLYNAQSINGTTIITSNGNLPMVIKVRGLKGE